MESDYADHGTKHWPRPTRRLPPGKARRQNADPADRNPDHRHDPRRPCHRHNRAHLPQRREAVDRSDHDLPGPGRRDALLAVRPHRRPHAAGGGAGTRAGAYHLRRRGRSGQGGGPARGAAQGHPHAQRRACRPGSRNRGRRHLDRAVVVRRCRAAVADSDHGRRNLWPLAAVARRRSGHRQRRARGHDLDRLRGRNGDVAAGRRADRRLLPGHARSADRHRRRRLEQAHACGRRRRRTASHVGGRAHAEDRRRPRHRPAVRPFRLDERARGR